MKLHIVQKFYKPDEINEENVPLKTTLIQTTQLDKVSNLTSNNFHFPSEIHVCILTKRKKKVARRGSWKRQRQGFDVINRELSFTKLRREVSSD